MAALCSQWARTAPFGCTQNDSSNFIIMSQLNFKNVTHPGRVRYGDSDDQSDTEEFGVYQDSLSGNDTEETEEDVVVEGNIKKESPSILVAQSLPPPQVPR